MPIPVTRSSMPPLDKYISIISPLWESRWLTNAGVLHEALNEKLMARLDAEYVVLFANGHIALEMGIQALGLTGEIITTPFTFASTTQAIVRCGCTPVFCDIDPIRFTIDPKKVEALITERTTAIVDVHVYGIPCYTTEIEKIAKKHCLKIIYDAAHAFGIEYLGQAIANFGDLSMFSFHATKVFHSVEGGCVVVKEKKLAETLCSLRNFGLGGGTTIALGGNGKMSEFHAAMGLCNIENIENEISKRREVSERYDEKLKNIRGLQFFPDIDGLKRNYSYYPIITDERDSLCEFLNRHGIMVRKYFYPLTNMFDCYEGLRNPEITPNAEIVANGVLCLPLYSELALTEVDEICEAIWKMKKETV